MKIGTHENYQPYSISLFSILGSQIVQFVTFLHSPSKQYDFHFRQPSG